MKKIKNPELYIKKLKHKIGELEEMLEESNSLVADLGGRSVWSWDNGYTKTFTCTYFPEIETGDQVILVGRVTSRKTWMERACRNKHAEVTFEFSRCRKTSKH